MTHQLVGRMTVVHPILKFHYVCYWRRRGLCSELVTHIIAVDVHGWKESHPVNVYSSHPIQEKKKLSKIFTCFLTTCVVSSNKDDPCFFSTQNNPLSRKHAQNHRVWNKRSILKSTYSPLLCTEALKNNDLTQVAVQRSSDSQLVHCNFWEHVVFL